MELRRNHHYHLIQKSFLLRNSPNIDTGLVAIDNGLVSIDIGSSIAFMVIDPCIERESIAVITAIATYTFDVVHNSTNNSYLTKNSST